MPASDLDRYRNLWSDEERRRLAPILARFATGLGGLQGAVEQTVDALETDEERREEARARWAERHGLLRVPADATTVTARLAEIYAPKVRLARDPVRGRVLIATAAIEPCEVVIVEPPLLRSTSPSAPAAEKILGWLANRWLLVRALDGRGPAAFALTRDLCNAHKPAIPSYAKRVRAARAAGLEGLAELSDTEVAHLLGIVLSNAHMRRSRPGWRETCLQPAMAMMAHSCDPNTTAFFGDTLSFVHALGAISEGEQLTAAYVPQARPVVQRLAHLAYVFGFVCDCPRCSSVSLSELEDGLRWFDTKADALEAEPTDDFADDQRSTGARWVAARAVVETILARRARTAES